MHRQRRIRQTPTTAANSLIRRSIVELRRLAIVVITLATNLLLGGLVLRLQRTNGRSTDSARRSQLPSGKGAAIVARAIVIETPADDLAPADDDASMTIVERGQRCLLKAEGEIHIVTRHDESFPYSRACLEDLRIGLEIWSFLGCLRSRLDRWRILSCVSLIDCYFQRAIEDGKEIALKERVLVAPDDEGSCRVENTNSLVQNLRFFLFWMVSISLVVVKAD